MLIAIPATRRSALVSHKSTDGTKIPSYPRPSFRAVSAVVACRDRPQVVRFKHLLCNVRTCQAARLATDKSSNTRTPTTSARRRTLVFPSLPGRPPALLFLRLDDPSHGPKVQCRASFGANDLCPGCDRPAAAACRNIIRVDMGIVL